MSSLTKMQYEPIEKGIHKLHNTTDFPMIGFINAIIDGEEYEIAPNEIAYPAGTEIFTASGEWTAPFTGEVEVFMVNGGTGGGGSAFMSSSYMISGEGGNGGNTLTQTFTVEKDQKYPIIVGSGGSGTGNCNSVDSSTHVGNIGGKSSFNSIGPNLNSTESDCVGLPNTDSSYRVKRQIGGSAGSPLNYIYLNSSNYITFGNWVHGGNPGSDGSNSEASSCSGTYISGFANGHYNRGQGTTTKAFGSSTGTIYSGGGGTGQAYYKNMGWSYGSTNGKDGGGNGGTVNTSSLVAYQGGSAATPNSGAGGGGAAVCAEVYYSFPSGASYQNVGGNGASGIVIIRWVDQKK